MFDLFDCVDVLFDGLVLGEFLDEGFGEVEESAFVGFFS